MNQRHRSYPRVTFRDRIAIPIARADRRWLSGLATTLLLIVGCGGSAPTTTAPSVATGSSDVAEATLRGDVAQVGVGEDEDGSTADLAEHHRHHHQGGFAMFIAMSLDLLNVSPDQTTAIVKIRNDMRVKMQPARDAEKVVLLTLANGIAAGKIDQPTVDAAIAQVTTAGGIHDTVADSLNELHATLTPPQRAALVDKVEAHFEVWHHTNALNEAATRDARVVGRLARLSNELGLSPEQVEAIRANLASSEITGRQFDRAEAELHMKAFSAAFASDDFDARAIATSGTLNAHMATWGVTRTVGFYQAVMPALTPQQRTKLADGMRRHANYRQSETQNEVSP